MLSLTKEEKQALIFVTLICFVGLAINILLKNISKPPKFAEIRQNLTKFDLNQADIRQIDAIKGFGLKISQRIIDYRKEYGDFRSFEELEKIKGLTKKRISELEGNFFIQ